jgi:hypothetical protein
MTVRVGHLTIPGPPPGQASAAAAQWDRDHGRPVPVQADGTEWRLYPDGFLSRVDTAGGPDERPARSAWEAAERRVQYHRRLLEFAEFEVTAVRQEIASALAMAAQLASQGRRLVSDPNYPAQVEARLRAAKAEVKRKERAVRDALRALGRLEPPAAVKAESEREEALRAYLANLRSLLHLNGEADV